jgi:hypothetical protein
MLKLIQRFHNLATASLPLHVTTHDGCMTSRLGAENMSRSFELGLAKYQIDAVSHRDHVRVLPGRR